MGPLCPRTLYPAPASFSPSRLRHCSQRALLSRWCPRRLVLSIRFLRVCVFFSSFSCAEYTDDGRMIPRNTSVVVSRVPVRQPGETGVAKYAKVDAAVDTGLAARAGVASAPLPLSGTGLSALASEEDRISAMQQSDTTWTSQAYGGGRRGGSNALGGRPRPFIPSADYHCKRCGEKGASVTRLFRDFSARTGHAPCLHGWACMPKKKKHVGWATRRRRRPPHRQLPPQHRPVDGATAAAVARRYSHVVPEAGRGRQRRRRAHQRRGHRRRDATQRVRASSRERRAWERTVRGGVVGKGGGLPSSAAPCSLPVAGDGATCVRVWGGQ